MKNEGKNKWSCKGNPSIDRDQKEMEMDKSEEESMTLNRLTVHWLVSACIFHI